MKTRFVSKFLAEFLGTAFLLAIVIGSGIMGERLSQGNEALTLLANSLATGAGLFVLIQSLAPVSGAHFNPLVSLVEVLNKKLKIIELPFYWLAQFGGGLLGVLTTHAMFGLPIIQISQKSRVGFSLALSEFVATFGLIAVIALANQKQTERVSVVTAASISAYILSAYWFTSSTSFANPAVTFARALTNTFCGIAPSGVAPFIFAQLAGALVATVLFRKFNSSSK